LSRASCFVFGGGSSSDAYYVAAEAAGPRPRRSDFGLSDPTAPPVPAASAVPPVDISDDDLPF
jgi:hypothetical protein